MTKKNTPEQKRLNQIRKECLQNRLKVAEAIGKIESDVGQIRSVRYHEDLKFNMNIDGEIYGLFVSGLSDKQKKRLLAMAIGGYVRAQENGNITPGEVHSKGASTRHYTPGINALIESYSLRRAS